MKANKRVSSESNYIKKGEEKALEKQELKDLHHKINMELNTFLVLREEGTTQQLALSSQKAKSLVLKHGPEMISLAEKIGDNLPSSVDHYINSVSAILHSAFGWIDEAVIHDYFISSQRLAQETHL
ncbi:MAG: hypothetical protein V4494_02020 [Chlamydiota bacterium]